MKLTYQLHLTIVDFCLKVRELGYRTFHTMGGFITTSHLTRLRTPETKRAQRSKLYETKMEKPTAMNQPSIYIDTFSVWKIFHSIVIEWKNDLSMLEFLKKKKTNPKKKTRSTVYCEKLGASIYRSIGALAASSAIQKFLLETFLPLLKLGFYYPEHRLDDNDFLRPLLI